ncbi:MAG TPA: glutamine--fructose-6-phosphate transaminase (isomerizing), partial [Candidatus Polarisedimenticolaceae bacterium]|nr:glutamine--fructose-6-phosphate transaminase (isomerizing) [Candidatus Polarisedimenticolaceae bacterium]
MCGIIGYVGPKNAAPILLAGLRRMEYRGYDSAGIALLDDHKMEVIKRKGKIAELAAAIPDGVPGTAGIGHTRWATHGNPSERNAHPHVAGRIALVHNGIIENYAELKAKLADTGATYKSDTDSEVLAHLINHEYIEGRKLAEAVRISLQQVEGTFGLTVISNNEPGVIIAARRGSPLLLGIGEDAMFVASDASAVVGHTDRVVYLEDDQLAVCKAHKYKLYDLNRRPQHPSVTTLKLELEAIEKAGYEHFLLKEIMEQPVSVANALRGRLDLKGGTSHLGGLNVHDSFLRQQERFLIIGCGTAYYAGLVGKYLLERMTGIPVDVEVGSEFRYREPALTPGTLALIISQSGETADTMACLRELKKRGVPTLGLINVVGSSLARGVDGGVYLHAGPEISVASTKAFTAQVVGQLMVGLQVGKARSLSLRTGREIVRALESLPDAITEALKLAPQVKKLAKKYAKFEHAMYLGRDSLFPVALEGSHKLKECSYIHAEAYPAGEMKHGANALIDKDLLMIFLAL